MATPLPATPTGFGIYALPNLPPDLVQLLKEGSATVATSRRDRARITQILYDDLRSRVGLYSSDQEVKTVCHTLVMTYPCLGDKIKIGQNTTRYYTWYESLRQKFKDVRRPLTNDEQVIQMKAKYGGRAHARRKGDPLDLLETPKSKTPRLNFLTIEGDGEDDRSIAQHIAVIQTQWAKASCDVGIINDRMVRTYAARREMVKSGAKLADILTKFPALKDQAQLQAEFLRMTRVNYIESLHQFFTEKRVDIALRLLSSDHSVQDVIAGARNVNIHEDKLNIILRVLPRLFGEKLRCWTQSNDDNQENIDGLTVYPTFILGEQITIYFERTQICKCVSVLQAAATLVMIYFVFDVQYPQELVSTCNFLETCVSRLDPKKKIRPCVQRKLNLLLAA